MAKRPPTSFSPVTSTNVGKLMQNFKFVLCASPKLLNFNQDHPSKKRFFWSNPCKIKVVITSFMEVLELPNFFHMNKSTIEFESRNEILLVTSSLGMMAS